MSCLHFSLFLATAVAAVHDINPTLARSLTTVILHVSLGRFMHVASLCVKWFTRDK